MKFLGYANDKEEAREILGMLRSKGIPVFTKFGGSPWISPYRLAIFVCMDQQLGDARAILTDKSHVVSNPIDVDEYERIAASQDHSLVLKWTAAGLLLASIFLALVLYVWRHGAG